MYYVYIYFYINWQIIALISQLYIPIPISTDASLTGTHQGHEGNGRRDA